MTNKCSLPSTFILLLLLLFAMPSYSQSINSLEEVTLGSTKQWIYITGDESTNPILLVIHGGPGFAMLPLFHNHINQLEKNFTVVNWDQRGAGKSYSTLIAPNTMTLDQLVADAHELTLMLKSRFKTQKIYILGHSSGTMIGILLAKKYLEDYYAYISIGQVVDVLENEKKSYDFALGRATAAKNKLAIQQLTRIGRPDNNNEYRIGETGYEITSKWVEYFGGELYHDTNLNNVYIELFTSNLYKNDRKKILKGYQFSQLLFEDKHMYSFNAESEVPSLNIPIYFISGQYDQDTSIDLVKRYYRSLIAPHKTLIEINDAAHFPFYEKPQQFVNIMVNRVLKETYFT